MALGLLGGVISALSGPLGTVAERYFDNKDDQIAFKNPVELEVLKNQKNFEDLAGSIVLAEAKSKLSSSAFSASINLSVIPTLTLNPVSLSEFRFALMNSRISG